VSISVPDPTSPASISRKLAPDELLGRIGAGDERAFETLYRAHFEPLWRFAYGYVHVREIALELVQDVFLAVWRTRDRLEVRTTVRAFLYAAVRHQALNYLRDERTGARLLGAHTVRSVDGPVGMGTAPTDPHDDAVAHELDASVMRVLDELPERRRVVLTLRWKHQLTAEEIAGVVGTSPAAVRVLLSRARDDLAKLLV
jgi:RNA polymerase sigma-70 factor (ECF subfamily)